MKNGSYETRKEQIEKGFMRTLSRDLRAAGIPLTRKAKELIKEELRGAAMVGACEERDRSLKLLRDRVSPHLLNAITADPVLRVLGYED